MDNNDFKNLYELEINGNIIFWKNKLLKLSKKNIINYFNYLMTLDDDGFIANSHLSLIKKLCD